MARIAGVDIPNNKRVVVALTYIYGVGLTTAKKVLADNGISEDIRVKDLTDEQTNAIRKSLDSVHALDPDMMTDIFFHKTKVEDDGKTCTIMGDDGVELSVADHIADWAKDNEDLIMAQPKGGAGSAGGNGGTQSNDVSPFMQALLNNKKASQTGGGGKSLSELFGA